jgi:hypothetical protein
MTSISKQNAEKNIWSSLRWTGASRRYYLNYATRLALLTPWSRVVLEKLTVTHLLKKFPSFYGTRKSITVFTRARHWSVSWATFKPSSHTHIFLCPFLPSNIVPSVFVTRILRKCTQKFPDWVDNEIYAYNNKHSLRCDTKCYGDKTH